MTLRGTRGLSVAIRSLLDRLVSDVNEACRAEPLDHVYRIGELVITQLYDGDLEAWRSERVRRASYRSLVTRHDLLLSPSALCRAVGVYALANRVGGFQRWKNVGVSHYQEVLPLPQASQERLLTECDEQRWTVATLRSQVRQLRQQLGRAGKSRKSAARILHAALAKLERAREVMDRGSAETELDDLLGVVRKISSEVSCLEALAQRKNRRDASSNREAGVV